MSKAVQEIVADLRKADMAGAQVDAGHIADQIALAFVELEVKWRREKAEIEANALAVGGIVEAARHKPGNAAAMREALVALRDAARNFYQQILNSKYSDIMDEYKCRERGFPALLDLRLAIPKANAALSIPARNCDLRYYNNATIDVCSTRAYVDYLQYCEKYGACCKCPMNPEDGGSCLAKYLLSPAEGVAE